VSHIRVLICRVDEPEQMTELAVFDLGGADSIRLEAAPTLDDLETQTHPIGNRILCQVLQAQWDLIDAQLTEHYLPQMAPAKVQRDGQEPLKVASRFGLVHLSRQVCSQPDTAGHTMPSNAVLPVHHGMLITRGVQEWACLLSQDVSFATAARLLGWQAKAADLLSDTTLRRLVRKHGQIVREAEQAEITELARQGDPTRTLVVVPHHAPRQRPGWPTELNAAVEEALAADQVCPPDGVSWADWARVQAVRRTEGSRTVAELRYLGPELALNEVLLVVDEVLTRQAAPHHFWELRTARLATAEGYRYVTGSGPAFLQQLLSIVCLAVGPQHALLLIADGARWIRTFFTDMLAHLTPKQLILDWYHLHRKCRTYCRRLAVDPIAQTELLRRVSRRLWQGKVTSALWLLERYRSKSQDTETLDSFIAYLQSRRAWIPNYRQRRMDRRFIGSGHVEKANDLLVAKRQKIPGMQWSLPTSDALAALRTLSLNAGWDRYWELGQVLPFAA
jgi:hypothetical protein